MHHLLGYPSTSIMYLIVSDRYRASKKKESNEIHETNTNPRQQAQTFTPQQTHTFSELIPSIPRIDSISYHPHDTSTDDTSKSIVRLKLINVPCREWPWSGRIQSPAKSTIRSYVSPRDVHNTFRAQLYQRDQCQPARFATIFENRRISLVSFSKRSH